MVGRIIGALEEQDRMFMSKALELAQKASREDEVPIGALVISKQGEVLGSGSNQTEKMHSQSRHAEVQAIEQAGELIQDWRLVDCTMYITVEPCLMCMSLICLSRISRLVYGATSPLFGYHLDRESLPSVYRKHIHGITSGVRGEESQQLLEEFFQKKRIKSDELKSN